MQIIVTARNVRANVTKESPAAHHTTIVTATVPDSAKLFRISPRTPSPKATYPPTPNSRQRTNADPTDRFATTFQVCKVGVESELNTCYFIVGFEMMKGSCSNNNITCRLEKSYVDTRMRRTLFQYPQIHYNWRY